MNVPVRGASRRRRATIVALVSATLFCLSLGLAPHQVTAAEDDSAPTGEFSPAATDAVLDDERSSDPSDGTSTDTVDPTASSSTTVDGDTSPDTSSPSSSTTSSSTTSSSTTIEGGTTTSIASTPTTGGSVPTTSTTDPDDLGGVFVTTTPTPSSTPTTTGSTTATTRSPATTHVPTTQAPPTTQTPTTHSPTTGPPAPTTPTTAGDDDLGPASVTVVTVDAGPGGTVDRDATDNRPAPLAPRFPATTTPQPTNGVLDPASASAPTTTTTATTATTAATRPASSGPSGGDGATTVTPTSAGLGAGLTPTSAPISGAATGGVVPSSTTAAAPAANVEPSPTTRPATATSVRASEATISQGRTPTVTGFEFVPVADGADSDDAAITVRLPWDSSQRIGVQLHPTRLLSAWTLWLTLVLLIMAFWLPSPSRLVLRARARGHRR